MGQQLLEMYTQSVAITYDNVNLQEILPEPQKKFVCTLADAVKAQTQKTCAHVKRVALARVILCRLFGLPTAQTQLIKNASSLHDIA